jgi:hypothetical protein
MTGDLKNSTFFKTSRPIKARLLRLTKGEVIAWDAYPKAVRVRCVFGKIWLTQAGIQDDIVLHSGDSHIVRSSGRVVAQALTTCEVSVSELKSATADASNRVYQDRSLN